MRYLLDTNILVFLLGEKKELCAEVLDIIDDFSNQLYTSSVCILELIQLNRIGKIRTQYKTPENIIKAIEEDFYIEILPFESRHTKLLGSLMVADGHNDPFDHAIISQGIVDRLIVVSSDKKFEFYKTQNLDFIFNKR